MEPRRPSLLGEHADPSTSSVALSASIIHQVTGTTELRDVLKLAYVHRGLQQIDGLSSLTNLVELNLTGNLITRISGLDSLGSLQKLVLTSNQITRVEGLEGLQNLQHLLLQDNVLRTIEDMNLDELAALPALQSVYFQNLDGRLANAVCGAAGYRRAILRALPRLRNLDGERSPSDASEPPVAEPVRYEPSRPRHPPGDISRFLPPPQEPWLRAAIVASVGPKVEVSRPEAQLKRALNECRALSDALASDVRELSHESDMQAQEMAFVERKLQQSSVDAQKTWETMDVLIQEAKRAQQELKATPSKTYVIHEPEGPTTDAV